MKDEVKTEHVTLRLKPSVKKLLDELAKRENRSQANLVETLILAAEQLIKGKKRARNEPDN